MLIYYKFTMNLVFLGSLNLKALDCSSAMSIGLKSAYIDYLYLHNLVENYTDLSIYYKTEEYNKWNLILIDLFEGDAFNDFSALKLKLNYLIRNNETSLLFSRWIYRFGFWRMFYKAKFKRAWHLIIFVLQT